MALLRSKESGGRTLTVETATGTVLEALFSHIAQTLIDGTQWAVHRHTLELLAPPDPALGDITFRCFGLANQWKKDAAHVAADLAASLPATPLIERYTASGPYLNIHLQRAALTAKLLNTIFAEGEQYGASTARADDVVVVEYISANTNKPLHIGHLRNGLIGWSVAELLRLQGAEVVKTDIVNDRGIHIVKSMLAYRRWGNGETPQETGEKPDHFIGRYYVRFDQEYRKEQSAWLQQRGITLSTLSDQERTATEAQFRAASALWKEAQQMLRDWEAGDAHVQALWKMMNDWAYAGWAATYGMLGFDFDRHYYESDVYEKGKKIIEAAAADGTFQKTENGAVYVPLSKHGELPDKVVLRADGTALYMTQDLYLANKRYDDFQFDRMLYVIGSEQKLYMQQLFATLALLRFPAADRLVHLSYGYVSLPEGRMKSREGTVVDADDLLAEMMTLATAAVEERHPGLAGEERDRRARSIALAALKFHFLTVSREQPMTFDPKASLAFEGRTGPYIQYAAARAASILRKAGDAVPAGNLAVATDADWQLVLTLLDFPRAVADAARAYEPSRLAQYVADLAQRFSAFYHDAPVLDADEPVRSTRLALVRAVHQTLANGLALLGIEALEEM